MRAAVSLTLFFSVFLCTGCALSRISGSEENCDRHNDLQCANAVFEKTDKQLAETYQHAADTREEEGVKRLAISQRHWLKYRDTYAEFIAMHAADAQSFQLMLLNQRIDLMQARVAELQRLLAKK